MNVGSAQPGAETTASQQAIRMGQWTRRSKIVARLASVQLLVQVLNALAGLILVRTLSKHDYALFTIAISIQTVLNLLADSGITAALFSMGGRVWQSPTKLGQIIAGALRIRVQLYSGFLIVVAPISMWLLLRNDASLLQALSVPRHFQWLRMDGILSLPAAKWSMVIIYSRLR